MSDERVDLAAKATVYGFPLVFGVIQIRRCVEDGLFGLPPTPFNEFCHAQHLAHAENRFVSINNDTLYSISSIDLSGGPVRLDVPDADGRYYVLQFVDAWTNNFAYVGHRSTGTEAASFLLVPPAFDGGVEPGLRTIRFPTTVAAIVGRWAVDGEADLPAVAALQAGLRLTPEGEGPHAGLPVPTPDVAEGLAPFEMLRTWMQAYPPADRDLATQARFEPLGVLEAASPYVDPDPDLAADLRAGLAQGFDRIEQALRQAGGPKQNGWQLTYHAFDYNVDFFEVGTIDDPAWTIKAKPPTRHLLRAAAARGGLWGNHGYEAAYAMVYEDAEGEPLDGSRRYALRFDELPPVEAFWSVTMYDLPDFYLVANPIDRFSIGDRTPGLHTAEDGSLTIVLQHDEPADPAERANWLPTPIGPFRPILRLYEPTEAIFDGSYELPPITRR